MASSRYLVPSAGVIVLLVVGVAASLYLTSGTGSTTTSSSGGPGKVVQVVAGENFWGSLVSQLGGTHVYVVSI
ncbi:MAG: ABC transporter substrate-binding protein, partial [Thaumarchaeota archaeon]